VRFLAGLVLLALTLTGCESNVERSARLAKLAHHQRRAESGLSISRPSAVVKVVRTAVVHGAEGTAVVVTVRNNSPHALRDVPIAITVKDASGAKLFQNNGRGLEAALTSLSSLAPHGEATWVDDQVQLSGTPASASAIVGEAPAASGPLPQVSVLGVHPSEEGGTVGAAGTVLNRSSITQQGLVIDVVARRGATILAAGRAVLPEVTAGASAPFQASLVGTPTGGKLEAGAAPTSLG
jgi:hypothetical protein